MSAFISRGFKSRRQTPPEVAARLPPGQYAEPGWPVLTAGPTSKVPTSTWTFRIDGMIAQPREWTWEEFAQLQFEAIPCDGTRVLRFDVGDGHFIDEITIGPIVLQSISDLVHERDGVLDCHLMVSEPALHIEQIKQAGGDSVSFHVEATGEPAATIAKARELGLGVGVALNPETPIERAVALAQDADLVLCMSIHPGLSGQELMPDALERLTELRGHPPVDVLVQVDGGVHLGNVAAVREAGADLLVSGSGVFWSEEVGAAYGELVAAAGAVRV
jgi:ribulose-phosphate 3-epimerase